MCEILYWGRIELLAKWASERFSGSSVPLTAISSIEGFHVTSYQANFASCHARDRHVGLAFAGKVMTSYSSNWITLLLLCTSAPIGFVLWSVRSWFKTGKGWTGRLVTEDYDVSLCQRIGKHNKMSQNFSFGSFHNTQLQVSAYPCHEYDIFSRIQCDYIV